MAVHWSTFRTSEFEVDIGDNDSRDHPLHEQGYNGIWSLRPRGLDENLFFEEDGFGQNRGLAGMNLEFYFDGETDLERDGKVEFDPRLSPMSFESPRPDMAVLRQPPTDVFQVESVSRYQVVEPHYIDFQFSCVPRRDHFPHGYLGVFWANYVNKPEDCGIRFLGHRTPAGKGPEWIHTCGGPYYSRSDALPPVPHNDSLKGMTDLCSRGSFDWAEPHFYGVIRGYLVLLMFDCDLPLGILAGGTAGQQRNSWVPWDFQILIPSPQVGCTYGLRARLCVTRFQGHEQVEKEIAAWNSRLTSNRFSGGLTMPQ